MPTLLDNKVRVLLALQFLFYLLMSNVAFQGMLHMRPYYDEVEASAFFLKLSTEQNVHYQWNTIFDFGFIATFTVLMWRQLRSAWILVYTLADVLETGFILLLLNDEAQWSLPSLGYLTAVKWISALALLVAVMLKWRRSFAPRRNLSR